MTFSSEKMALNSDAKPRNLVYSKLERLMQLMNDQKTGVPLKDKKNFLYSTVHNSFTGSDLIIWLTDHICEQDSLEALHLATFLCMYGYIYPVDIRTYAVKDDKSVFYRFQSPYYWPSMNLKLTNEKYIIYLLKRSKRNKQKHGLEEYEQNALSKLQIVFSDKMGFVSRQAAEQVRLVKDMKRDDKMIHDLQERAFWRVHRPPPGQVKYLEERPSRCFQPSQMESRKKKNRDLKIKEIGYLKKALTRPRMKFSKSIEIFVQHSEQYMQYDPLLDTRAAQPSNPWISEDEMMWDINGDLVEVPTINRIKKWAVSFEDLLHDEKGLNAFEQFLKKEYSQENINFYKACKELVTCPNARVSLMKAKIEKDFLTAGAAHEVNVDGKTLEMVTAQLKEDKDVTGKTRYIFQPAMDHVYALMKKDSYTRFLRSEQYKQLLEKSQTHYTKKKFFNFGSNRKKTPSPLVRRRGSASSDGAGDNDIGGPSYHSYSTGNLRELDEKPKRSVRTSYVGSDSSIYMGTYDGQSNSPSVRRRTENMDADTKITASNDPRRRSNLEVPRSYQGVNSEGNRKSESVSPCLAISVPRTNIVTPWEGES
ncbi:regulator of G-protein signaling 6-like isoform X3 [Mercenaria mercenaria]|uniref:regulator of G-protein signaling 6-like isoform X3 n=1 Tax=Mercenaria mercenaria TaxID=6596 RepID=UPI00234F60A5|nr:regulator of G-protein signaling 6-like isoform X3 [Mercenaria mercenaria]